jgi:hypothetical protein
LVTYSQIEEGKNAHSVENVLKEEMKTFLKTIGSNRHLRASALSVDFKTPFSFLAELPLTARSADAFSRE